MIPKAIFQGLISTILLCSASLSAQMPSNARSEAVVNQYSSIMGRQLQQKKLTLGSAIFIRIFKQSSRLELWVENSEKAFTLFKAYKICAFSGGLGPKTREGDGQSPEGFYFVRPQALNPWSRYYLSFNLGYPNAYDRFHQRTGSYLMVHGNCVSIGCYAMSNDGISEIYTLAYYALTNGQDFFRVHIFPFELTSAALVQHSNKPWYKFWLELKPGYDHFLDKKRPPNVDVVNGRYIFTEDI